MNEFGFGMLTPRQMADAIWQAETESSADNLLKMLDEQSKGVRGAVINHLENRSVAYIRREATVMAFLLEAAEATGDKVDLTREPLGFMRATADIVTYVANEKEGTVHPLVEAYADIVDAMTDGEYYSGLLRMAALKAVEQTQGRPKLQIEPPRKEPPKPRGKRFKL